VALGLFLVGGLALIGLYHLGLYLARSKESAPLYFALYCLSIATWSAQSGQKLFSRIIDGLSGSTAIRIEYMGLYLGVAAFLQFAGRLYPADMPTWPKRILASIALACGLSGLVLPIRFFIPTLPPMQIVTLLAVGLCIYWTFQSVRNKRLGAYSVGLSLLILAITVTNDVLVAMAAIDGIYLAPYGLMIFIVGQSFALSMRLANAFNELEGLSRDLEERVQERTDDLDSLNELTRVVNEHQELDYIVSRTSQFMVEHLGMRRMFFFLIDKKDNQIRGNGGQIGDLPEEERQFFLGLRAPIVPELGTLYRTIQKKKTLHLDFRRTRAPESVVDRLVVEQLKMTSVVEIPAMVGEEVLGIAAIDPGDRKVNRDELRRMEAVVAQISGAVQKQLYLERIAAEKKEAEDLRFIAEREREESDLLAELGREINRGASIEDLLSPIGRASQSRLGANSLALYLPDERQNLVLRAGFFRGEVDDPAQYPEVVQSIPLDSDASALPQVFHRKRAIFLSRVDAVALQGYAIDFALYEFWKYDWVALLPLLLQDRSIGLIAWSGPASNRISRKDLPFLKRVAETITGAIENLRLLEQVREKQILADRERKNNEVLAGLSRRAIEGEDINDIVFAMREAMQDVLGRHGMAVYLPDAERTELSHICVIREGAFVPLEEIPDSIRTFPLVPESGSLYWSFHKAKSWFMPVINPSRVERSPIDQQIQQFFGFSWCYHIPLVVNDEAIGIVTLAGRDKVSLTKEDRELLERMVAQVAGAIRMQQLLQTIEKEKDTAGELQKEARALADFTRLLNQRTDLRSMVQEVCHFAVESLGLRGSFITVVNESAREFQSIGGYGKDYGEQQHIFVRGSRVPMNAEAGLYQATYSRKKTIHMRRIPANAGEFNGLLAEMFGLKSFALVPLILEDRVIGIMGIDPGEHRLSKEDLNRLEVYADQVAGAINNANLMQQVEEQRSSIEGLAEISRMAASTDNLEEILDQIFAFVHRRYDIASGIIMLPDSEGKHLISYKAFSFEDMERLKLWDSFDYARTMKLPISEEGGTLARTFLRGKPFYVPDAAKLNRSDLEYAGATVDREILKHLRYRSYFSLPMHVNGEPVALLNFTAYKDNFNLSRNARNELKTLADQLAGIIRARQLSDGLAREKQL
ncbi:MAG: GAF domain-containing protein, partial [Leptospiraceae bacterium]|nr:GAF domain-containing protein [Leptospiraceae bacterium]